MTKNEALKAAIDGKKFTHKIGVFPMFFNGDEFLTVQCGRVSMSCFPNDNDYEIVPEFVDFAEAWKAYENGKQIQGENKTQTFQKDVAPLLVSASEIRGKWLILDA